MKLCLPRISQGGAEGWCFCVHLNTLKVLLLICSIQTTIHTLALMLSFQLLECLNATSISEIPQLLVIRELSQDKGHLQPLFYSFLLNVINGL